MNVQKVDIKLLKTNLNDVKHHNKKNIQAIQKSLSEFGQYKPLIVDTNYQILVGKGTYIAMKKLGYKQVDVVVKDLTENQKNQLIVIDNRSSQLSEIDNSKIEQIFYSLDNQQIKLTAFSDKEVDKIMNQMSEEQMDDKTDKVNSKQLKITCPYCKTVFNLQKE